MLLLRRRYLYPARQPLGNLVMTKGLLLMVLYALTAVPDPCRWNGLGQLGQGDTNNRGDQPGEMGSNLQPVDLG